MKKAGRSYEDDDEVDFHGGANGESLNTENIYYSIEDLARTLKVRVKAIEQLISKGELGCFVIDRQIRITSAQFERWVQKRGVNPGREVGFRYITPTRRRRKC